MKHQRTVTIEFERVKITASHSSKRTMWCELCRKESEFLDQTEAAEISRAMQMQGLNLNKTTLHIRQHGHTGPLVCFNSILNESVPAAK
jgi:hypothetical protein